MSQGRCRIPSFRRRERRHSHLPLIVRLRSGTPTGRAGCRVERSGIHRTGRHRGPFVVNLDVLRAGIGVPFAALQRTSRRGLVRVVAQGSVLEQAFVPSIPKRPMEVILPASVMAGAFQALDHAFAEPRARLNTAPMSRWNRPSTIRLPKVMSYGYPHHEGLTRPQGGNRRRPGLGPHAGF